jgi:chromosome transmission fidelity protein 4
MAARNRFLAVIYHESMPLQDGTQKLGYMIYDAVANKTISKGSVSCISSGSSLSWVGFSNDCSFMAMDSDGMLSMLVATSTNGLTEDDYQSLSEPVSWEWSPLLDTVGLRKSSDDSFWPVTVFNGKLVCVPLKGGTQYPDAGRRPVTTTLSLRMPLARSTLQQCSALEEVCIRSNVALVQKKINNQITSGELMGEEFDNECHTLCAQVVSWLGNEVLLILQSIF